MPIFERAEDAYEFCVVTLQIRRGAKGARYERISDKIGEEPSLCTTRNPPNREYEERVLHAIRILGIIELHDIYNGRPSWFADYFMPDPTNPPEPFEKRASLKLFKAISAFECDLACNKYMRHCNKKYCRKRKLQH